MSATETAAARNLAEFLMKPDPNRLGNPTPLEVRVRQGITELAGDIAREVIAAHPELHDMLRHRVVSVVAAALRNDAMLNQIVTGAVAAGLGQIIAEQKVT